MAELEQEISELLAEAKENRERALVSGDTEREAYCLGYIDALKAVRGFVLLEKLGLPVKEIYGLKKLSGGVKREEN